MPPRATARRCTDGADDHEHSMVCVPFIEHQRVRVLSIQQRRVRVSSIQSCFLSPDGRNPNPGCVNGRNANPGFVNGRKANPGFVNGRKANPGCVNGRKANPGFANRRNANPEAPDRQDPNFRGEPTPIRRQPTPAAAPQVAHARSHTAGTPHARCPAGSPPRTRPGKPGQEEPGCTGLPASACAHTAQPYSSSTTRASWAKGCCGTTTRPSAPSCAVRCATRRCSRSSA